MKAKTLMHMNTSHSLANSHLINVDEFVSLHLVPEGEEGAEPASLGGAEFVHDDDGTFVDAAVVLADGVDELVGGAQRRTALRPIRGVDDAREKHVFFLARLQLNVTENAVEMMNLVL